MGRLNSRVNSLLLLALLGFMMMAYINLYGSQNVPRAEAQSANNLSESSVCRERRKMGFLKTHKTASSSVQNIILRYGYHHKLNFVLPSRGNHLNDPRHFTQIQEPFKVAFLDQEESKLPWHSVLKPIQGYDIFALHTQWNYSQVSSLLGPEAVYFTILRHPSEAFESLFSYANFEQSLGLTLSQYIASLNVSSTLYQHRVFGYLGLNQQLFDLGLSSSELYESQSILDLISHMERTFDLVMIEEMFDESMVLLSQLLCWPLHYLSSLKVNARKTEMVKSLSPTELTILSEWQHGEEMLYQHFESKFVAKVKEFGVSKMKTEVAKLRRWNQMLSDRCVLSHTDKNHMIQDSVFAPWSPQVTGYNVRLNDSECALFAMSENHFVDTIRQEQTKRFSAAATSSS